MGSRRAQPGQSLGKTEGGAGHSRRGGRLVEANRKERARREVSVLLRKLQPFRAHPDMLPSP